MYSHNLHKKIAQHLEKVSIKKIFDTLKKKYNFEQKTLPFDVLVEMVQQGEVSVHDVVPMLEEVYEFDFATAVEIDKILYKQVWQPIEDQLDEMRSVFLKRIETEPGFKPMYEMLGDAMKEKRSDELEDISEARIFTENLENSPSPDEFIREIIDECEIDIDSNMENRFMGITLSRLKDIRNDSATLEALTKSTKIGGIAMTTEQSNKVLTIIKKKYQDFQRIFKQPVALNKDLLQIKEPRVSPKNAKAFAQEEKSKFEKLVQQREGQQIADSSDLVSIATTSVSSAGGIKNRPVLQQLAPPTPAVIAPTKIVAKPESKKLSAKSNSPLHQVPLHQSSKLVAEISNIPQKPTPPKDLSLDFEHQLQPPTPAVIEKSKLKYRGMQQPVVQTKHEPIQSYAPKTKPEIRTPVAPLIPKKITQSPETKNTDLPQQTKEINPDDALVNKRLVPRSEKPKLVTPQVPKPEPPTQLPATPLAEPQKPEYLSKLTYLDDELRNMTLENFKQLDLNPKNACEKVADKIQLLESERSFTGRVQGVKAWQKSEPYKIYLEMGRDAMMNGTSIVDTVKARIEADKPSLSLDEFNAITQLNKKLKF